MNQVKVKKSELLTILRKNRTEHRDIFLKAQTRYREVAIKELDAQLKAARNGRPFVLAKIVELVQPKDYTSQYDRAIQMLEMSVDETVVITAVEFQNFVQDKWNWSRDWAFSNSSYVKSAKLDALSSDE